MKKCADIKVKENGYVEIYDDPNTYHCGSWHEDLAPMILRGEYSRTPHGSGEMDYNFDAQEFSKEELNRIIGELCEHIRKNKKDN